MHSLRFLTGRWVSETPAEIQEENWSPVRGGSMIGSFRIIQHGQPVFYEFWAVELDAGRPVLKLKHYNGGLVGWEEKAGAVTMPLVSIADNDAVFTQADGSVSLRYHLAANKLTCVVHHVHNGEAKDESFVLTREP